MSQPRFSLTKTVPLTLKRPSTVGGYVDGVWQEATTSDVVIQANIQPVKDEELMLFPESERSKEWYKIYSTSEIKATKEGTGGWDADRFQWKGDWYRVMKVRVYQIGVLDHYRAMAAREPRTPN